MRWIAFPVAGALLLWATEVQGDFTDLSAALAHWSEQPLDLASATAAELAELPWIDWSTADAIVGLRQAQALNNVKDLLLVPGIDAAVLEAVAPFIVLARASSSAVPEYRIGIQGGEATKWRDVDAQWRGLRVVGRRGEVGPWRGSVWWKPSFTLAAGDLLPRVGWDLLGTGPTQRGRTAPVSFPRAPALRAHRSVSLPPPGRGLAFRGTYGPLTVVSVAAVERDRWLWAADGLPLGGGTARWGAAARRRGGRWSVGLWLRDRAGASAWRLEFADPARPTSRVAGAFRTRVGAQRWGLAVSLAPGGGGGIDPITGLTLDRPHAALQAHGSRRVGGWRWDLLARRVRRGSLDPSDERRRWSLAGEGDLAGGRCRLEGRLDSRPARAPELAVSLAWRNAAFPAWHLTLRQRWLERGEAVLASAAVGAGQSPSWRAGVAASGGPVSSLWVLGLPGFGAQPVWVPAGGYAARAALRWPTAVGQVAVWAGTGGRDFRIGFRVGLRSGE